jgi:rare lipoprotein A
LNQLNSMKNWKAACAVSLALFLSSKPINAQQTGYACIYSDNLCGGKVATGGNLNCASLTAAHRTFGFGAQVLVTNLDNDKSVTVTINDRGPFNQKDIIDLTPAAAKKIGLTPGIGRVRVRILKVVD